MNKINSVNNEIYIADDFSINLYSNDFSFLQKNFLSSKLVLGYVKNYHEFRKFLFNLRILKLW